MNLEAMLEYVQSIEPVISEAILLNTNDAFPEWADWNPSMFLVAEMTAEYFDTDVYEDEDFAGLWEATCEIVRRDTKLEESEDSDG